MTRPAMLCCTECWPIKGQDIKGQEVHKIKVRKRGCIDGYAVILEWII